MKKAKQKIDWILLQTFTFPKMWCDKRVVQVDNTPNLTQDNWQRNMVK
jgi:hypothetical protein